MKGLWTEHWSSNLGACRRVSNFQKSFKIWIESSTFEQLKISPQPNPFERVTDCHSLQCWLTRVGISDTIFGRMAFIKNWSFSLEFRMALQNLHENRSGRGCVRIRRIQLADQTIFVEWITGGDPDYPRGKTAAWQKRPMNPKSPPKFSEKVKRFRTLRVRGSNSLVQF